VRLRQAGDVTAVCWSANGKLLVTSAVDAPLNVTGVVTLWDAATGRVRRRLPPDPWLDAIAVSPDGKTLAGTARKGLWLTDIASGRQRLLKTGTFTVAGPLALSPDGKLLAAANSGGEVALLDLVRDKVVHLLRISAPKAAWLGFSPNSKRLIVPATWRNRPPTAVHLFDVGTGKEVGRLEGHKSSIDCAALSADGKLLATGAGITGEVRLWDMRTRKEVRRYHVPCVGALAFSPSGKILATADGPDVVELVHLRDVATGKVLAEMHVPGSVVASLAFSPDGRTLAAAAHAGVVGLWRVPSGEPVLHFPGHEHRVVSVAFSPDGRRLASRADDRTVRVWDIAGGKQLRRLVDRYAHYGQLASRVPCARAVRFSPDGRAVAAASMWTENLLNDGPYGIPARVWDAATGRRLFDLTARLPSYGLDFSPGGEAVAFSGVREGNYFWRLGDGQPTWLDDKPAPAGPHGLHNGDRRPTAVAFSPDGHSVAYGDWGGSIRIWDWRSRELLHEIQTPHQGVVCLAYSPDGKLVASCAGREHRGGWGSLCLWDVSSGRLVRTITQHRGGVSCVAFSPDGRLLGGACWGDHNAPRVWDAFTGELLATFDGHTGQVNSIDFSPDGRLLASGSDDCTILLWDLHGIKPSIPQTKPSARDLEQCWAGLADADPATAYAALFRLAGGGVKSVRWLSAHLNAVAGPDPARVRRLIADLDARRFARREAAAKELEDLGCAVEPALREALAAKPSAEVRRHLDKLLAKLPPASATEGVRNMRAVQALELIGSKPAQSVLRRLAQGAPGAGLTRDAKGALARLARYADAR
jgi:WD40 repeat protein